MNWLHCRYCASSHWSRTLEHLVPWALEGAALGDHVLELGPGPGRVTSMLSARGVRVTALDHDVRATDVLRRRLSGAVAVVRGDAGALPFAAGTFSAVVACAMLHHVPGAARQDRVFHEARRALRAGAVLVGLDPRDGVGLRLFHLGDTCVPLAPDTLGSRLAAAGFHGIQIETRSGYLKFSATA